MRQTARQPIRQSKGRHMMRLLQALIIVSLTSVTAANAAVIAATSCSSAAVQAAINSAASGDTVVIPGGSCTWTSGVTISGKGVILRGQSPGQVTINNNVTNRPAIDITESNTHHTEISNLTIVGNSSEYAAIDVGTNAVNGTGQAVLIHHIVFTNSRSIRMNTNRGVIYSNTMNDNKGIRDFVQCTPGDRVPNSWTTVSTMGTADATGQSNVYVEDNVITFSLAQSIDIAAGCRIVIRHNTFDHSALSSHGADTEPTGLRHFELYDNTFIWINRGETDGSQTVGLDYFFFLRGGTGVITNNTGLVDMISPAWGNKAALKATVMNLQRNAGPNPCWGVGTTGGARYPAPRQIGLGRVTGTGRDGLNRLNDSVTYVGDSEPLYIWNQPGLTPRLEDYGSNNSGACSGPYDTTANYVRQGRDYFVGTPKPGWTPYTYPHPLRSPGVVQAPSAPQNLRIVP